MKSFKELREELSPDILSQFKSSIDKPRRPYTNVGGQKIKKLDLNNDSIIDKIIKTPAHEIVFNTIDKKRK